MATIERPDTGFLSENSGTSIKEVDRLIELAEQMQNKCDESESQLLSRWFAAGVGATVSVAASIVAYQMTQFWWVLLIGIIYAIGFIGVTFLISNRARRKFNRDTRALYAIVDMLREIENYLARESKMSTLERAEFRIRLSRFGIGSRY